MIGKIWNYGNNKRKSLSKRNWVLSTSEQKFETEIWAIEGYAREWSTVVEIFRNLKFAAARAFHAHHFGVGKTHGKFTNQSRTAGSVRSWQPVVSHAWFSVIVWKRRQCGVWGRESEGGKVARIFSQKWNFASHDWQRGRKKVEFRRFIAARGRAEWWNCGKGKFLNVICQRQSKMKQD